MKARDMLIAGFAAIVLAAAAYLWLGGQGGANDAPAVRMTLLDGRHMDLASLRGHPVLINFWATTCPGCVAEMPQLSKMYRELAPQGFRLIGVAMYYDPPAQVRAMRKARNIPYPIVLDSNADISKAFGDVRLTPTSFLIDAKGRIVYQKLGNLDIPKLRALVEKLLGTATASTAPTDKAQIPLS
ncbi:MAG: TlpA disulfide reductase family protein [Acidihalobacter sp.]|jgi:peroxiredoxin